MIYQKFNFIDSYSNASGNRRDSMVLSQLGNVISTEPKAVKYALQDAGISVSKTATRKDLIKLIVANKTNKQLVQNLSILITANNYSAGGYDNFGEGDDDLAPLPTLSASQGLKGKASGTTQLAGNTTGSGKGSKVLQSIGNFFKKRSETKKSTTDSQTGQPSGWQRFTSWFSKNKDTINQVGQTLYNSLGQGQIPTTGAGDGTGDYNTGKQPMPQRTKVFIAIGVIAVVGLGYYFLVGKGKSKGK